MLVNMWLSAHGYIFFFLEYVDSFIDRRGSALGQKKCEWLYL